MITAPIIVTGLVVLALLYIALLVFVSSRSKKSNVLLIFVSSLSAWMVLNLLSSDPTLSVESLLWLNRLVLIFSLAAVFSFLIFLSRVLDTDMHSHRYRLALLYAMNIFSLMISATGLVIGGVYINDDHVYNEFGLFAFVYFLTVTTNLVLAGVFVAVGYRRANVRIRAQVRQILISVLVATPILIVGNIIMPLIGNYSISSYAPLSMVLLSGSIIHSIIKHGLVDIKPAAVRSLGYFLSLGTLTVAYAGMAYALSILFFQGQTSTAISTNPLNIVLALALAFIFQPVKNFFDKMTDSIFYRDRYDVGEFLLRLGRILTSTTRLYLVMSKVGQEVSQTLKSDGVLFVVYRDNHPNEIVGEGIDKEFTDSELDNLKALASQSKHRLIVVDMLESSDDKVTKYVHKSLAGRRIAMVLPLASADETIGYLMLGEHKARGYTRQDREVLETIADQLVIAIQNARSVQVVRDLNAHLEQRVEDATKELRATNKKLVELDATKDDFISMASHQLRTPLTSIKGYLSMVLEGDVGKVSQDQHKLLSEAFVSSERMVNLIGDFLNVSRLQTGKFTIEQRPVDIALLVDQEVSSMQQIASTHDIRISFRKPSRIPILYLDDSKLRQVVMNFIDNAIYYSPESHDSIDVKLGIEDGCVAFRVIDHGIGVPLASQKNLFTKFFRADNARRQRPDGTGVGLYLAKKIIDGHHGQIIFESTEDKGSTFGFRLPIKKLSETDEVL